jgi:nitroimidazol reductase NimA-like FMN-containing flavoprotein (pyridoxamine 5'-phosphate oxidase superfamily)
MKFKSNIQDLSRDAIDNFLGTSKAGVLSFANEKTPYAIPLAYFYEDKTIYLTLGPTGRKMEYIHQSKNVSFTVFSISEGFGMPGKTGWTSVICEGVLENVTAPEELTKVVRAGERHFGIPEGTWENLLQMTLKDPKKSNFWKIRITSAGGRGVEDEKIELEE